MFTRRFGSILAVVTTIVGIAAAQPAAGQNADGRDADRAAIRAHIESIFQAFIDGDVKKIFATHAEDWRGFLESTRTPIKGIDEYMRANGISWPPPPPGEKPPTRPSPPASSTPPPGKPGYAVKDFDVQFYSPDLAVACFLGEFNRTTGDVTVTTNRLRIMDVYARRAGGWIQVASNTVTDPPYLAERMTTPANLSPAARQQVLDAREAVWRAYFTNDQAALEKLIPAEAVTIDEGAEWGNLASILAGAKRLAETGTKLMSLEFPKTELQVYGSVVIVYTTYRYELETNGKRSATSGRATEMFVRRGGAFVNVGWHLDTVR